MVREPGIITLLPLPSALLLLLRLVHYAALYNVLTNKRRLALYHGKVRAGEKMIYTGLLGEKQEGEEIKYENNVISVHLVYVWSELNRPA